MAGRNGIDWFPMDTDTLTDDEKVFDLMEETSPEALDVEAFAAFGRWVALMCRIYREGPAMVLDGRAERKLARDLGMTREALLSFIGQCVSSGLLDRVLWERERVLTSRGIQRRWCAAKKRTKALPAEMRSWSLLDGGESREISENSGHGPRFPKNAENASGLREISENSGPDKKREEEKRLDEIREEEMREDERKGPSFLHDGQTQAPPCMVAEQDDGTWYADDADGVYPTIGQALEARYRHVTGLADFPDFVRKVAARCPPGCRGDPDRARTCHNILAKAIDRFEPSRGTSVAPLALRIIDEDRGF